MNENFGLYAPLLIAAAAMFLIFGGYATAALTANRQLGRTNDPTRFDYPVAAAVRIYKDGFVGKNPAGYAKPFVPGDEFVGIAEKEVDNSAGAAAALNVPTSIGPDLVIYPPLTDVAIGDAGKPCFALDDNSVGLTGHPDAFVGYVIGKHATDVAAVLVRRPGEKAPNGLGSVELFLRGAESFEPTGAASTTKYHPSGLVEKSILGLGVLQVDAEDGGVQLEFDAVAEIALASLRGLNETFPVDKGITFEATLCVTNKGDNAALDIDFGLGTALTTNSEADIDHADMAQLAAFHLDGNSDNILAQSDDATTDVASVDTTVDNDSTTDVPKKFKIIVRPSGAVEFWIAGARVLSSTVFAVLSTTVLAPFVNVEKTSDDTVAVVVLNDLRVAGGKA